MTDRADSPTLVAHAVRMARVFDHDQVVTLGDGHERVHIDRQSGEVDRNDGACPGRHSGLDRAGIDIERSLLKVREDRRGVCLDDRRGRRDECVGRDDHFVTRFDAGGKQGDTECHSAIDHGNAVLGLVVLGKSLFKLDRDVAGRLTPLATVERADQGVALLIAEDRPLGKGSLSNRLSAVDC